MDEEVVAMISEINGIEHAQLLRYMNGLDPDTFPALTNKHLSQGYWWVARVDGAVVAFSGMVPFFDSADGIGYLKRAYVLPDHRGQGLQLRFIHRRERKAKELGWSLLVTETSGDNLPSQRNMLAAGFEAFDPEQKWGAQGSVYFKKSL